MRKKILIWLTALVGALILTAGVFLALALLVHPKGTPVYADEDFIVELQKKEGEDFRVLNLTDIQSADLEDVLHLDVIRAEIDDLVARTKPHLITVTGDLVWSNENNISLHVLIRWLDSYGIPWAPVLGNHDRGNEGHNATASGDYLVSLLEKSEYCLFRHGLRDLGCGNYVVLVKEGEKAVRALWFLDNGTVDSIGDAQIKWVDETATALEEQYGALESMLFMHKPTEDFADAYFAYLNGEAEAVGDVHCHCSLSGVDGNGLSEVLKKHRFTDAVCGHQHTNAFTISYEGIRWTFALKTGELSFYYDDGVTYLNGGTLFNLSETGTTVEPIFADREKCGIKGSDNQFEEGD